MKDPDELSNDGNDIKPEAMMLIREGITAKDVARILGVKRDIVRAWMKQEGLINNTPYNVKSIEDRNNVMDLLREDKKFSEISRLTNISTTTIRRWKKEFESEGFLLSRRKPSRLQLKKEGLQMIRNGSSEAEVARRLGRSEFTVHKWRKDAGLSGKRERDKEEGLQMIRNGSSEAEVARRLGVSTSSVGYWRKVAGLSGKRERDNEEGLQMIRDGDSVAEVAKQLGVHKNTVRKWMKAAGLSKRNLIKEEDILKSVDAGSTAEVARRLGVSTSSVGYWRKVAGLSGKREKDKEIKEESSIGSSCKVCTSILTMKNTYRSQRWGRGKSNICKICNDIGRNRESRKYSQENSDLLK